MPILMQEQIYWNQPNIKNLYDAYKIETTRLGEYYTSGLLDVAAKKLLNYGKTVKLLGHKSIEGNIVQKQKSSDNTIDIGNAQQQIEQRMLIADLAGMCSAFHGWKIFLSRDIEAISKQYLEYNLSTINPNKQEDLNDSYIKLELSDTSRCIHLLKLLGLLPVNIHNCNLLSIGAAAGNRERYSMNTRPGIDARKNADKSQLLTRFTYKGQMPRGITLIDSDPFWSRLYTAYNASSLDIMALNKSLYESFSDLSSSLDQSEISKYDFVTIWRLEHTAFEDIDTFFNMLKPLVNDKFHFLATIGAGNDDEEFSLRQKKIREFSDYISDAAGTPVLIKMHNDSRLSPLFGHYRYASHELLYCTIDASTLG